MRKISDKEVLDLLKKEPLIISSIANTLHISYYKAIIILEKLISQNMVEKIIDGAHVKFRLVEK